MALETGTYISDLVVTNPVNATDQVAQGDDHIRLIKSTLKNTFPNIDGAVTATEDDLNILTTDTAGAGILSDLASLADPNADRLFGWDDSASAAVAFSLVSGELEFSGTTLGTGSNVPLLDASNTFTGTTQTAPQLRLTATGDVTLASTDHGLQIGASSGTNLALDTNEIEARNNGAAGTLGLQSDGGTVTFGVNTAVTEFDVNATTLDLNGAIDADGTTHDINGTTSVTLTGASAVVTLSGTEIDLTATTIDINGATDISGILTLSNAGGFGDDSPLQISNAAPSIRMYETDGGTNGKSWTIGLQTGVWALRLNNDTGAGTEASPIAVTRSGTTVTEVELNATALDFNGAADVSGTLTVHDTLTMADDSAIVYAGETVELGANDSGGSGFRVLRVANA